ncbi:MAG: hypothetical protein ACHREM_08910 [Polyangiales bacterium]
MEAIITSYTSNRSGQSRMRAVAYGAGNTITIPFQHGLDSLGNHEAAAKALSEKMNKMGYMLMHGLMPNGHDYVWLFVSAKGRR